MPTMRAGQAVVEILKAEGTKYIFGLPGGHVFGIYDALNDAPEIRHILVRHEQIAANMAGAYAQLTGEPGVCIATAGGGATNLVTGIADAFLGSLPVIALTGRGATRNAQRGANQEIPQDKIFAPITKWSIRVDRADMVVEIMRRAFTIARGGKPGPVLVDFPADILMQPVDFDGYVPVGKPPAPRADEQLVQAAVERLLSAERPIIIAGGGTVSAGAFTELQRLAEALALPVLTSLSGRGSFPDDHPLAGGGLGLHHTEISAKLLREADFVLGLGCRFEENETNWKPGFLPAAGAHYVQVDIDPTEMGRGVVPSIGIVGDIRRVLEDMIKIARQRNAPDYTATFRYLPRIKELAELKERFEVDVERSAATNKVPMSPLRVVTEIREAFPRESSAAVDVGYMAQAWGGAFPFFKVYEPRSFIAPSSLYDMGFATAGLPVARLAYPDRPAVGICGDGAFQMVMSVLPVAAEYHLPVTWCILDDHKLGSVKESQDRMFGRSIACSFGVQPDFTKIAEACGCYGERVEDPRSIRDALGRAIEANNRGIPAVLDFLVAEDTPQGRLDFLRARG